MIHKIARLIVLLIMILIFSFSSQVATQSSAVSGGFTMKVINILPMTKVLSEQSKQDIVDNVQAIVRKSAHFSIYFLLGFFVLMSLKKENRKIPRFVLLAFLICVFYASTDEVHQLFVLGRGCRLTDVLIDSSGSLCGFGAFYLLDFLKNKIINRKKKRI